ncbi:2-polyprenyl-6-methoxyphenol hydroxylase-like FAD-dependent oxidoreductase [Streptomyces sp. PvR006]|uniref:FAD-dependent oxidoreductase n=1 Tax=Streptomyces sp. PvR006 TaxID=2817860 RepID=UPI001AE60177|nr:FAD-dependent oxidoreductase [Streptomyces sp. PvR006]MBP2585185.1 2-polyprenyl-6-methoxyphenol hydroxylase-like FAD-dependent oxidoreductase [Streptomyces sp. PvR006]
MSGDTASREPVAVVGAGPVGLTAALVLARTGVRVTLLESRETLATESRASTFHPSTLDLLDELGVAAALRRQGRTVDRVQWRDLDGVVHADLDYSLLAGHTGHPYRLHVEQARLTPLLLAELTATGLADIRFGTTVTGADHIGGGTGGGTGEGVGGGVRLRTEDAAGRVTVSRHPYVLAADGSRSALRELAGLPGTAEEYPDYALRVVTGTPLDELVPGLAPLSYVRDTRASFSALGMPDHWRLIFRIPRGTDRDAVLAPEAVRARVEQALPGAAGKAVRIADAHTYRLARFLLPRYRAGRVLFAGDAAHLTSTAGGLNMNCGIHDAVETGRALASVLRGDAPGEAALDAALERRRSVVETAVIPRSEARTAGLDSAAELPARLASLRRTAADPRSAVDYLLKASLLDVAPRPLKGDAHADLVSQAHR